MPAPRPDHYRLRLLNRPAVLAATAQPPRPLERRDAALLAWLAWHGEVARQELAGAIWPEIEPAKALASLRQRLFRLRRTLGVELVLGREALSLHPAVGHDLAEVPEAVLQQADGELLGGLDYSDLAGLDELVAGWRSRWRAQAEARRAERAEALEAQGQLAEALAWAQSVVHANPLSEHAHRRVMRLHYRRGDRAAALAAFDACRGALRQGLDVEAGGETQDLARLIERSEAPRALAPVDAPLPAALQAALRHPPRLVGREAAWADIVTARAAGRWVLIVGEAGIGKSRLAEEVLRAAGARALWLKAHAGEAGTPHALLARAVRAAWQPGLAVPEPARAELARWCPELGVPASGHVEALRLQQAWAALMAAAGVSDVVIDDLQWADAASLACLLGAAAGREHGPALLMTWRGGEVLPDALAARLPADEDGGPALCRVVLAPLDGPQVEAFVDALELPGDDGTASRQRLAAALLRRTGGRPLFMLELLRAGRGHLPAVGAAEGEAPAAALRARIASRLDGLSAEALRLLRVAALMDSGFTLDAAAAVLAVHPLDLADPVRELEAAQLLVEDHMAFDLATEAVLATVPASVARLLHPLIAAVLQSRGGAPAQVAAHWQAAQRWPEAALQFERAAELARQASRRSEELTLLDAAAGCHRAVADDEGEFRVALLAAAASMYAEAPERVETRLQGLRALATGDAQRLALAVHEAKLRLVQVNPVAALEPAERALALALALQEPTAMLAAAGWRGLALALTQQVEAGLGLFAQAQARATGSEAAWARRDFRGAQGYALLVADRYEDCLAPLADAALLAESLGDLGDAQDHLSNRAVAFQYLGRHEESLACLEQTRVFWERMGRPEGLAQAANFVHVATALMQAGRFGEAVELLQWSLLQFERGGAAEWEIVARHRLARLFVRVAQFARARQVLGRAGEGADTGKWLARLRLLAQLDAAEGRSGLAALQAGVEAMPAEVNQPDRLMFEFALASFEPAAESLARYDRVAATLPEGMAPARARALVGRADALRRLGRGAEAAASAREAVALAARAEPLDMDTPTFWWMAHEALQAGSDADGATAALREGWRWLDVALAALPPGFRPGFESRHGAVRQLLQARQRQTAA